MEDRPSLWRLTATFLKIGNLTFGGGDPTVAALQREFLDRRRWLSPEDHALAYAMSRITPGANVLAYCAGSAWRMGGVAAAALGVTAASLPSAAVSVWLMSAYAHAAGNRWVEGAAAGMMAAVAAMMPATAWILARPYYSQWLRVLAFVGGTLALRLLLDLGPAQLVALSAAAGAAWRDPE